ncbi:Hsp33 family molecular chaperone HslO [Niveibacterium sp. 24ML]|uniref:Hsp33 family molecular chaperone HslO n=1 Tax=Niveibacterium sp. 24ML TaxID=2985512 RepID=UPI0022701C79|nr:Hsp33 family molecular chaperone HslO [Niveibacterium sp. 24ML]MCX9158446.1 Hsp33 family molecular chaperone HslO [Niveibacterium sp. 24ML]
MDIVQRFLFDELDIRGALVQLGPTWKQIQRGHDYAPAVRALLGELAAVTTIIAGNLKTPGRITLQLSGSGSVPLLVIDCSEALNLRGFAKTSGTVAGASVGELLGGGRLLLSFDTEGLKQPYQSYVPLEGDTIAKVFEAYLRQSEQTPAALFLAADGDNAAGLFLQKLPGADEKDPDGWGRITGLANTVTPGELLSLEAPVVLTRLFHEETVRVFDPKPVSHVFPPDWEKVRATLRALGRKEIESILAEHGEVFVRDDLSNHDYRFSREEALALFDTAPPTLH